MSTPIEEYAFLGDTETAALVCTSGSIDWVGFPRFDSASCFGALLGNEDNGYFKIAPKTDKWTSTRSYRDNSLILETFFETKHGSVKVTDFMPVRKEAPTIIRIVEGLSGKVEMHAELIVRFDYGKTVPWVKRLDHHWEILAGPNALKFTSDVEFKGEDMKSVADFKVKEGERKEFVLTWYPSNEDAPPNLDVEQRRSDTEAFWHDWAEGCTYTGSYKAAVIRSLLTLKGLTYAPTGGIVAAATTSLPEVIGGERNWDYRHCWMRDSTFVAQILVANGFKQEAKDWVSWLLRAVAGTADQLQIMYGIGGERTLVEYELDHLPGYENSKPVRVGNGASEQFQLDVFGEVMDTLHVTRVNKIEVDDSAWTIQKDILEYLADNWQRPDDGIWEVRGEQQHFTHSKVMAWVAFDRGIKAVEDYGHDGPVKHWRRIRDQIHDDVMKHGWNKKRKAFTQFYGSNEMDASLLMLPMVGFIDGNDERMVSTVKAIEDDLLEGGLIRRYISLSDTPGVDGLEGKEGAFLPCSFWLADNYFMQGRKQEATDLFERLLDLRNDVGLIAEEYDVVNKRQLGNFPQAFTHLALVNSALLLSGKSLSNGN